METLDLTDQKVDEGVHFFVIGEDTFALPIIRHASLDIPDEQLVSLLADEIYEACYKQDASYLNTWMKGMFNGMAVTVAIWGALWVVGKLVFG